MDLYSRIARMIAAMIAAVPEVLDDLSWVTWAHERLATEAVADGTATERDVRGEIARYAANCYDVKYLKQSFDGLRYRVVEDVLEGRWYSSPESEFRCRLAIRAAELG